MLRLPNIINSPNWGKHFIQDDITNASTSKEDIVTLLGEGVEEVDEVETDEEPEKIPQKTKILDTDDEPDESDEDDDDEVEIDIEEDDDVDVQKYELITPVARKAILKEYPDLFKKFPYLEAAYYRDKQFTEVFPTLDDAKRASEKSTTLDEFESDLLRGNTEKILKTVKGIDNDAFNSIVDDYLPALGRVDKAAYDHVLSNVIKHTVKAMVLEGKKNKNDALEAAASILHTFVFNTNEFTEPHNLAQPRKENPVDEDRKKWNNEMFDRSRNDVSNRIGNALKSTIDQNIDPKGAMTSYVKNIAVERALNGVVGAIEKDKGFKIYLDKLWTAAINSKYAQDDLDKIRKAYITKAKTLLPAAIKKERIEALKGLGKRTSERIEEEEESDETPVTRKKKSDTTAPVRRSGQTDKDKARAIPAGTTSLDYLMKD